MKPYQRGDVVIIDVPMLANSHIQAGKRPWVVVQNNVGNQFSSTSIVVPLTTKIKRLELPTHVAVTWGSLQPSMVECEQVRVVDVSDDWEYICTLPPEIMRHVDTALKNAFFYGGGGCRPVSYTTFRAPRTKANFVSRLFLEKKKQNKTHNT